jgi:amino acid permease
MSNGLFSREEALTGFTARRARALLFLIESRTAHLVAQASQAAEILPSEMVARDRDWAFYQAFTQSRQPPLRPTIQNLERYASQWTYLVPENPMLRATIARLLGEKYEFTEQAVPGIRLALGLDAVDVHAAYRRLYGGSLKAIFRARLTLITRLRWSWAALTGWLESLPPFWFAFAVSIPIGGTTLALPIALANLGPIPGVISLIVLGLVNVLTVMALSEAVVRHGAIRFGNVFFGRLVNDYLGQAGSLLLSVTLAAFSFGLLLVFYMGLSSTLADATSIPSAVWCLLLLFLGMYFLSRGSLNTTVGTMIIITAINVGLLFILAIVAMTGWQRDNLFHVNVPFINGQPFDPGILGLIFGVVLGIFFTHMSIVNFAPLLLRRDPGGKAMIRGHSAGVVFMIALASVWLVAVNGALAPEILAAETGTVLVPLAARFGPTVRVLGSLFVILSMGMGSIFFSLALFNLVQERLPARSEHRMTMPRERGRLLLHARPSADKTPIATLTYLGLDRDGKPGFRLTTLQGDREIRVEDHWSATDLNHRLELYVLHVDQERVQLCVLSPLVITFEGNWEAVAPGLGGVDQGLTETVETTRRIENPVPNQWGRFALSSSPVVIVCVIAVWLSITGGGSFAGLLSFLGVATSTLAAGIFPILLLIAARRKGDRLSSVVYSFLGNPILAVGIYLLFLASLFVHGLFIWTGSAERAGALVVAAITLVATLVMVCRGAFARRLVVELCDDQLEKKHSAFSLVAGGQKAPAQVRLVYSDKEECCQADNGPLPCFDSLRQVEFCWTHLQAREFKVWVHRITPDGQSTDIPVVVCAQSNDDPPERFDAGATNGTMVIPLGKNVKRLSIHVEFPASAPAPSQNPAGV